MQAAFKRIVRRGQLEFVGGGWSQNDEVTTAYYDVIGKYRRSESALPLRLLKKLKAAAAQTTR